MIKKLIILIAITAIWRIQVIAQNDTLGSPNQFNRQKFWKLSAIGAGIYGGSVVLLSKAWYQSSERTSFHLFDDWGEWKNIDKLGHSYTAYFETDLLYQGASSAGMNRKSALWTAASLAMLFQGTIEMLDAYSADWGFSIYDLSFNTAGIGLFLGQELVWREQKIRMKMSSWPQNHPSGTIMAGDQISTTTLENRADMLFGNSFAERFLKDYNRQTIWVSFNLRSFLPHVKLPAWINLAIGYGGENMYGGFENRWVQDGAMFELEKVRYGQLYLAPDIDWRRIRSGSKFFRTLCSVLNVFKVPSPALEFNRNQKIKLHFIHW